MRSSRTSTSTAMTSWLRGEAANGEELGLHASKQIQSYIELQLPTSQPPAPTKGKTTENPPSRPATRAFISASHRARNVHVMGVL